MLAIQLASMESDLRTLNNASNKTNNDVSNLSNITLDIRHTLGENNEQGQNSTGRLIEIERIMNKTNNDVSNLFHITLDIKHTLGRNNEQDQNSTGRLNEIERVMNYLKAQLRSSAVSFIDMERRTDQMNSSMVLLNTTLLNFQKEYSVKVAFTAGMPSSSSTFSGGTLVFPSVITNIGGGYNPSTGIFSAPNDGLYVFYVSGLESGSRHLGLDIHVVLNGVSKVRLVDDRVASYQTVTNMVVLNLQQGNRVWVKHMNANGYYSESVPITTFSGFQIHV
ncbi:multimerin-1-like [Ostrea edulis]|uniref:multimerin-1-like n=1 Tax=Ostrea edulis TaxID=37623 RepID=UPI0024AE9253|nr:multimerin-1-like [Ostrea edulis]